MMFISQHWRIAVLLMLLLGGCTHSVPPEPTRYQIPANIRYSEHWVPTPAVDLMSADGTFVRAFVEAEDVWFFNLDPMKDSYPGFNDAYPGHPKNRAYGSDNESRDEYGFATRWILNFTLKPDDIVVATVCTFESINSWNKFFPHVRAEILTYRRVGASPPINQKGAARAPAVSVFGDWYAVSYEGVFGPDKKFDPTPCSPPNQPSIDKGPVSTPGWPSSEVN